MSWGYPVRGVVHPLGWSGSRDAYDWVVTRAYGDTSLPEYGPHNGIDIGNGRCGDPVFAVDAGKVTYAAADPYSGGANIVIVTHADGLRSWYAHLGVFTVKAGQSVTKGQQLGTVGKSGWATACHLHLQADRGTNATTFDPWPLIEGDEDVTTIAVPVGGPLELTFHGGSVTGYKPDGTRKAFTVAAGLKALGWSEQIDQTPQKAPNGLFRYVIDGPLAGWCVLRTVCDTAAWAGADTSALEEQLRLARDEVSRLTELGKLKDADVDVIGQAVAAYHTGT